MCNRVHSIGSKYNGGRTARDGASEIERIPVGMIFADDASPDLNILDDPIEMRMRNGKRAETFLPREFAPNPSLLVDVIARSGFDVTDQIRRSNAGLRPMRMCV